MKPSETIFSGKNIIIPMADVQHIEKVYAKIYENKFGIPGCSTCVGTDYDTLDGIQVITDKTKWNFENDCWENAIWIGSTDNQAQEFLKVWCNYRSEIDGMVEETQNA
jgi:hypothetical protein